MKRLDPADLAVTVAGSFTAGFLFALMVCHQPAKASDPGQRTPVTEDAPLPPTAGCNPYIVIHPPDLPPDASNMNGVSLTLNIGDVCGHWQAQPRIVPSLPLPKV